MTPGEPCDVPFDRSILAFEIDANDSRHAVAKALWAWVWQPSCPRSKYLRIYSEVLCILITLWWIKSQKNATFCELFNFPLFLLCDVCNTIWLFSAWIFYLFLDLVWLLNIPDWNQQLNSKKLKITCIIRITHHTSFISKAWRTGDKASHTADGFVYASFSFERRQTAHQMVCIIYVDTLV